MVTAGVLVGLIAEDELVQNMVMSMLITTPLAAVLLLATVPLSLLTRVTQLAIVAIPLLRYLHEVGFTVMTGKVTLFVRMGLLFQVVWILGA